MWCFCLDLIVPRSSLTITNSKHNQQHILALPSPSWVTASPRPQPANTPPAAVASVAIDMHLAGIKAMPQQVGHHSIPFDQNAGCCAALA
jgi:hypothetical protein